MKTRVLKFLGVVLITVAFAVSFFAIPVSAALGTDGVYRAELKFPVAELNYFGYAKNPTSFDKNSFKDYRPPAAVVDENSINSVQYAIGLPSSYNGAFYGAVVLGVTSFGVENYSTANKYWVEPFSFSWQFGQLNGSEGTVDRWRLTIRKMTGSGITHVVGFTEWNVGFFPYTYTVNVPRTSIQLNEDVTDATGLVLCFDYHADVTDPSGDFDHSQTVRYYVKDSVVIFCSSPPNNPNSPFFPAPSDQGVVEDNSALENEILESDTVQDLEQNIFELGSGLSSSLTGLMPGLTFCTSVLNRTLTWNQYLKPIFQISLSLGITASLLGIAGSIIGAAVKRKGGGD